MSEDRPLRVCEVKEKISSVVELPSGHVCLASGENLGKVIVFSRVESSLLFSMKIDAGLIEQLIVLPDGYVAAASLEPTVKVFDVIAGKLYCTLRGDDSPIGVIAPMSKSRLAAVSRSHIYVFDLTTGRATLKLSSRALHKPEVIYAVL